MRNKSKLDKLFQNIIIEINDLKSIKDLTADKIYLESRCAQILNALQIRSKEITAILAANSSKNSDYNSNDFTEQEYRMLRVFFENIDQYIDVQKLTNIIMGKIVPDYKKQLLHEVRCKLHAINKNYHIHIINKKGRAKLGHENDHKLANRAGMYKELASILSDKKYKHYNFYFDYISRVEPNFFLTPPNKSSLDELVEDIKKAIVTSKNGREVFIKIGRKSSGPLYHLMHKVAKENNLSFASKS